MVVHAYAEDNFLTVPTQRLRGPIRTWKATCLSLRGAKKLLISAYWSRVTISSTSFLVFDLSRTVVGTFFQPSPKPKKSTDSICLATSMMQVGSLVADGPNRRLRLWSLNATFWLPDCDLFFARMALCDVNQWSPNMQLYIKEINKQQTSTNVASSNNKPRFSSEGATQSQQMASAPSHKVRIGCNHFFIEPYANSTPQTFSTKMYHIYSIPSLSKLYGFQLFSVSADQGQSRALLELLTRCICPARVTADKSNLFLGMPGSLFKARFTRYKLVDRSWKIFFLT